MRKIKFRAWDKQWRRWIDPRDINFYGDMGWMFDRRSEEGGDVIESTDLREVALMQFTGLKDKNGKEIYEGDILQFNDIGAEGYEYKEGFDFVNQAVVTFEDGRFTLDNFKDVDGGVCEELNYHEETVSNIKHSEVIGNIYANPELVCHNEGK